MPQYNNPVVSIICDTYNHVNYLAECLDSLVNQQTNFNFEILVHDDASNDGTDLIVKQFSEKYPDLIKPIIQKENQYSKGVSIWKNFQAPRIKGKYVCICEGDDYWIDKHKLQKQFDFLENNSEYGMVYSKVKIFNQEQNQITGTYGASYSAHTEIYEHNLIPTLSVMMRSVYYIQFLDFMEINKLNNVWKMGDYPLWIWIAEKSKIHFIDEYTAVYRVLRESMSHSSDEVKNYKFRESSFDIQLFFLDYYEYDRVKYQDRKVYENTIKFRWETRRLKQYHSIKEASRYLNKQGYKWLSFYINQYSFPYAPKFYLNILRAINKKIIKSNWIKKPML